MIARYLEPLRTHNPKLGWLVVALTLVPFYIPPGSNDGPKIIGHIADAVHVPLFAIISAAVFLWIPLAKDPRRHLVRSILVGVLLAALTEFLQPFVGRGASVLDVLFGTIGVLIGVFGAYLFRTPHTLLQLGGYATGTLLGIIITLIPIYWEFESLKLQQSMFPILGNFEHERELAFWHPYSFNPTEPTKVARSEKFATSGQFSLKISTPPGAWAGVEYQANNLDWGGYKSLCLDVFNDNEEFFLQIRIDDRRSAPSYDERFNTSILLKNGLNHLAIAVNDIKFAPAEGLLDINNIQRMLIFVAPSESRRTIFIDHVRLNEECIGASNQPHSKL